MNQAKVASALNTISLAFGELAEALTDAPQAPTTAQEESPFVDVPEEAFTAPQGSLARCPKHRVPYIDGAYGPFCKEVTDDPAWGKVKGDRVWCRITPKNAADYLRSQAA